jgi:hypothetical protein
MSSDSKIEKALSEASIKIELAGVSSKENGNLDPFADPSARGPTDEAVHLFLKEATRTPCLNVLRSLETHQTRLPRHRILNGFGAASQLAKAPYHRGIIPITGIVMRSDLETQRQKTVISNEAKADVQEKVPMTEAKEIIDFFSERAAAEELTTALVGRTPELVAFRPTMTQGVISGSLLPMLTGGVLMAAIIAQAIGDKITSRRSANIFLPKAKT